MLIMGLISETFISIGIWILSGIYTIVSSAFRLFLVLAEGKIVAASAFSNIFNNVYVIIGVVMLFILAFALLKGMVNPDDKKQGASTVRKVITNLITSSIIVVLLPTIFSFAYDFQDSVLYYNVIGKLFGYGVTDVESNTSRISIGANRIANGVFTAFFSPKCENGMDLLECQDAVPKSDSGRTYGEIVEEVNLTGNFIYYTEFSDEADNGDINFNFIMGLIAGLALLYVAISFCFDMAVRLIKLVFYQLIAPIPIYFRVIPEGKLSGSFNNWVKITLTCYLEVFIRILIFYFCVFIFNSIFDSDVSILDTMIKDSFLNLLAKAFIIMGIVMFMKQAPKLFSEITGLDSGNMKLGIREKLKEGGAFTAGAIVGAGATGFVNNAINAGRNVRNKYKESVEKGDSKKKTVGKTVLAVIGGIGSTIAGTTSSQYRGFIAGKDAKSEKDMVAAAGKGAKGAVDARDNRAAYKARHGGTAGGALAGHVTDAITRVGGWAGLNNVNALIEENKTMDEVTSSIKAIDSAARDLITGDANKANKNESYGITAIDSYGEVFNTARVRKLQQDMEAAKGTANFSTAQNAYDSYMKSFADLVSNQALLGSSAWENNITKKVQADLSDVRQAADKAREVLARNISSSFTKELNDIATATAGRTDRVEDILDKNKDLTVEHVMLKEIKDEIKIKKTKNSNIINEVRQKEAENKKSGS